MGFPIYRTYAEWLRRSWPRPIVTLGLAVLAAVLTLIFVWLARQDDLDAQMPEFIGLLLLAGILYVVGVFLVNRFRLGTAALLIILSSAVLFRIVLLPAPANLLSDDVYRYQWDGRAQRAHLNPYVVIPKSPQLAWLLNPDQPDPPGSGTPTFYPPLSELAYRLIETIPGYKRASTLLDLASTGMLMVLLGVMKQPLHRVLAYAWNPAVLISFAMSGHFDSLAILTLLAALFFLTTKRSALSIVALALSFLSKLFPVLLLVTFLKRMRLAYAGIFASVVLVFYLPFWSAGSHLLDGTKGYAQGWLNNASLFNLLHLVIRSKTGSELAAGLIVLAGMGYLAKAQAEPLWASLILTGTVLLVSPVAYPWYFTWSIPFLCFYPSPAWLLMCVTSVLAYTPVIADGAWEPIKSYVLMTSLEYGPVYIWLAYHAWAVWRHRASADAHGRANLVSGRERELLP